VNTLPSLSAYIGADIIAGIASLQPHSEHVNALFIDVGTNGEMALITSGKIYCCATAAGPAFEGARIGHGMGAVTGAIHAYYGDGQYQTIGDSKPLGICGSGLIDIVDAMLKSGLLGKDGCLEEPHVVVPAEKSGTSMDICIAPQDIREVQLAKSAIAAGIRILIGQSGLSPDEINALYLAGGFGNHIRTESAVGIGLLPRELARNVVPVGNTSGAGALLAVQSTAFDAVMRGILDRAVVYELSEDDQFFSEFALNMNFPDGHAH